MVVKEVLDKSVLFLKNKGLESPRLDAELLISFGLKIERIELYLKFDKPITNEETEICRNLIVERAKGVPVAYLVGKKGFYKHDFSVNSHVLIPRPETELLVEYVLTWIKEKEIKNPKILELGSGSGCISISLMDELLKQKNIPSKLISIDVSKEAIEVSKKNANEILKDKANEIQFLQANAFEFYTEETFDFIISNPPYIEVSDKEVQESVKKFEPHLALFAEQDGLKCIFNWSRFGIQNLNAKGLLIFEIGCKQGPKVLHFFEQTQKFNSVEILKDYSGFDRFVKAVRNG